MKQSTKLSVIVCSYLQLYVLKHGATGLKWFLISGKRQRKLVVEGGLCLILLKKGKHDTEHAQRLHHIVTFACCVCLQTRQLRFYVCFCSLCIFFYTYYALHRNIIQHVVILLGYNLPALVLRNYTGLCVYCLSAPTNTNKMYNGNSLCV